MNVTSEISFLTDLHHILGICKQERSQNFAQEAAPRDIFIFQLCYVRYFKPDSFHAMPIDAMLKFGSIPFYLV